MIFDNKRAEVGVKGMDSHKAVAEVEADVEVEGGAAVAVVVWQIRGQQWWQQMAGTALRHWQQLEGWEVIQKFCDATLAV